ncbi:Zinc metalloproteinase [Trichostrongylus colubriformis]|uniref:Zinc metalloproteinase n=1 Tax=Trichostrongylus colubriformis TaxID=6319 RepID=A0AAN8FI96_TRICO
MRVLILILLMAVCVSAGLVNMDGLKKSLGAFKDAFKQGGNKIMTALSNIKDAVNRKMMVFKEKLSKYRNKILEKLHLTKEERQKLLERLKFFKRKDVDHVDPMGDSITEVNLQVRGDDMFQGDMALTKDQQDKVVADIAGTRSKRQAYNDADYPGIRWHKGVHYFFDRSASQQVQSVFKKAARQWMADTCINFVQSPTAQDSIRVVMEHGCWSFVGRMGGKQNLSLGLGCVSIGTAAHELGHALGLFHTHARHDRDLFITVDEANILPDWLDQFTMESPQTNNNYNITYDYGSLMHYGASTSSIVQGKLTMVPKNVQYTETLGSPFIGFYDLLMINRHYKCTDNCKSKKTLCQNHGYPNPRSCSKCICPSGYGGDLCQIRPTGCGDELQATNTWKLLKDEIGDRKTGNTPREDFMKCNYWIRAPKGKKIEVKIVSFTEGIAVDGCTYAGVEIKTNSDQRLSGHRFCSKDDANTLLKSDLDMVPVITYNRLYASITKLEYRYI